MAAGKAPAVVALICLFVLSSCARTPETVTSVATTTQTETETVTATEEELVPVPAEQRAQVASLMTVGVKNYDDALHALREGAGGIFIASWTDPALLTAPERNLAALKREVGRPFSVTIDAEGGRVVRQPELLGEIPAPRTMADTSSAEDVENVAFELGKKLNSFGTVSYTHLTLPTILRV